MYEAAKYNDNGHWKWAVFNTVSRCFFFIGKGRRFCEKKSRELNENNH